MTNTEIILGVISGIGGLFGAVSSAYVLIIRWNAKTRMAERSADVRYAREQQQKLNDQRDGLFQDINRQLQALRDEHIKCREETAVMRSDIEEYKEEVETLRKQVKDLTTATTRKEGVNSNGTD